MTSRTTPTFASFYGTFLPAKVTNTTTRSTGASSMACRMRLRVLAGDPCAQRTLPLPRSHRRQHRNKVHRSFSLLLKEPAIPRDGHPSMHEVSPELVALEDQHVAHIYVAEGDRDAQQGTRRGCVRTVRVGMRTRPGKDGPWGR
jgi:hypothetical protein